MMWIRFYPVTIAGIILAGPVVSGDETSLDFARDVRPILSNHCFQCHGPDNDAREAELRLDTKHGLDSVVDRDDLQASAILSRIMDTDDDVRMPPAAANKPLSAKQQRILRQWVMDGAVWQQHWAFVMPQKPDVPDSNTDWARNEIDAFAWQRIRKAGLTPSPEADPYTLVRRLHLDLTGLPPTLEQADEWVERIWPDATVGPTESKRSQTNEAQWQALISHLLHSPAWGERWARRWLDLARYADTNGYEKDRDRSIWPFRDWVINAFNSGMTFDQFTIEQIAGDMLPNATQQQLVATGFHRNTMLNEEGGIDPLEFRFHAMTDRVATTGTTWLGLTLGCAQCHTHKFDPISHREYYRFMALLNNADEPTLRLTSEDSAEQSALRAREAATLIAQLADAWPDPTGESQNDEDRVPSLDEAFSRWLQSERATAADWTDLTPTEVKSTLPILEIEPDGSVFASGDTAKRDDYWISLPPVPWPVTAIQLEALPDARLPMGGPGTTYYEGTIGDFFLNELTVTTPTGAVMVSAATESYAKDRYGKSSSAQLTVDGDVQTGWSVHERQAERHTAVYRFARPLPPETPIEVHMVFGRHFASSLGRFRFSATDSGQKPIAHRRTRRASDLLARDPDAVSDNELQELRAAFLLEAEPLKNQQDRIRELQKAVEVPATLVMQERPADYPRPTWRHHRGEFLQQTESVSGGTPDVLPALPAGTSADRLALAKWLVSPQNPLTPRVVVNRHWAALFGTGIVRTVEDFGLQGEFPTHPDLLDWLAITFSQDDGWSVRDLHRRIVSSSLYRQSSIVPAQTLRLDPENRWWSHAPRFRLDAEIVRDRLLAAAGVLNPQTGGPSVRPPQPKGALEGAYRGGEWNAATDESRYRRSLYTYSRRTVPFAMLTTFDAPSGEACIARRSRSNNPLQALTLLNDVMFTDLARHAGRAVAEDADTETTRATLLFRRVLVRPPEESELQSLIQFAQSLRESFKRDLARARKLTESDETAISDDDAVEQAVWIGTARALFALDETVMRD